MTRFLLDLLVRVYPRAFRERYGSEVRDVLAEDHRRAKRAGYLGEARFWLAAVRDAGEAGLRLRLGRDRKTDDALAEPARAAEGSRGGSMVNGLGADVRFAGRSFRRQPGFHALAVVTVALGVAATTSVFSVLDGVVRRPLPYPAAERLVQISLVMRPDPDGIGPISHPDLIRIAENARTLDAVAGVETRRRILTGEGDPRTVTAVLAAEGLLELLGARPVLGRLFAAEDHSRGATPVVVLPYQTWTRVHGRDPDVLGRMITLDGRSHEVIGVLGKEFISPEAVAPATGYWRAETGGSGEYWMPLHLDVNARGSFGSSAIGRLAPGASVARADAEVRGIVEQAYAEGGATFVIGARVRDLRLATIGEAGSTLRVLMGAVALLLAIGCMNVANLMLVRAADRSTEVALRTALGATGRRIVRQLVTESVVIALAGGALGALMARGLVSAFLAWGPGGVPRLAEISLDERALAFAFAVSALTGIIFGLVPALRSTHIAPARALVSGRQSAPASVGRLRSVLIIAETAMALVLVLAAGLLVNSFVRMRTVDPGFDVDGLVTARLELRAGYEDRATWQPFWDRVLGATEAIPTVEHAAITAFIPFIDFPLVQSYTPEGMDIPPDESVYIVSVPITPDFVETLGLRIVQGRDFDDSDRAGGEDVAMVSETLARTYWPGETNVVGRRIKSGSRITEDEGWYTIVGVVSDARHNLANDPADIVYHPLAQQQWRQLSVLARTSGPDGASLDALRNAIRSVDPGLPLRNFGTLESLASASVIQPRFYSALVAGFGAVALLLALVGIYGTAAYATARRAREIGIRIALGAEKRTVLSMLTFEAAKLALVGVALGVPAAIASMRLLEGYLFGIAPTDPVTFIVVSGAVATTALLAAWLPARRAAAADPMVTLRSDA